MTNAEIARRRLAAQQLVGPTLVAPADVVRTLGAVQAQDYAGAKWAIAQRTTGVTDDVVERAMTDGAIIRTHVLRPTWHFVAPDDLRWMLALTGPRVKKTLATYDPKLGIDAALLRRSRTVFVRALGDGAFLTRPELADALRRARIEPGDTQRLAHLVMHAELDGVICSGPRRGKQFTYALVDTRVPATAAIDRDEALQRIATRYFATRSPATVHDFAWWSGLSVADARRAIAAAGAALVPNDVDGVAYWSAIDAPPPLAPNQGARLLPNYDELLIGFRDRGAALERVAAHMPDARSAAPFIHVVEVDGLLVGGWTRTERARTVVVALNIVARTTAPERRAIRAAADRLGAYLGLSVETT